MATLFKTRGMKKEDWPSVRAIYEEGIKLDIAVFEKCCPPYEIWDAAHLKICRYVITEDGAITGWAALSPVSARAAYRGVAEVSLYITEACRHRGLGARLLRKIIRESEKHGIWSLLAVVIADNAFSVALCEKCGFRRIGRRERIAQDSGGRWRDTVMLELRSNRL
ncbi:MAG: GNAT family N-acetyltransferase [Acidaminococcales bacterium]|jgi:phosphinothricin acetyltransferase|nr:GNAT family N-acetyltransferase [Acidaminococcales bacterium]